MSGNWEFDKLKRQTTYNVPKFTIMAKKIDELQKQVNNLKKELSEVKDEVSKMPRPPPSWSY